MLVQIQILAMTFFTTKSLIYQIKRLLHLIIKHLFSIHNVHCWNWLVCLIVFWMIVFYFIKFRIEVVPNIGFQLFILSLWFLQVLHLLLIHKVLSAKDILFFLKVTFCIIIDLQNLFALRLNISWYLLNNQVPPNHRCGLSWNNHSISLLLFTLDSSFVVQGQRKDLFWVFNVLTCTS